MEKRMIIGFGNYSMGDDGIGLRVVDRISEQCLDNRFAVVEAANDGMKLLTYFVDGMEKILIVDCARMGRAPGEAVVFRPEDVLTEKVLDGISTHEGDVIKLIELAKSLSLPIPEIMILAIEPSSLEPEMELSSELESKLDDYVRLAVAEMEKGL